MAINVAGANALCTAEQATASWPLEAAPYLVQEEPVYKAHGVIPVAQDWVRYTVAATESCDPSKVTAIFNGLGGF